MPIKTSLKFAAVAAMLSWVINAQAASGTWNVDAAGNWSTAGNWTPAAVPGTAAGDTVGLTYDITAARTVTIDTTSRTVGTLNIGDSGSSYFGYTLTNGGGATLTFNNSGSRANLTQVATTASDIISLPITLSDNLCVSNNSTLTFSSVISGAKTLCKIGTGTLMLSGVNTFTGGMTNLQGTVSINTISNANIAQPLGKVLSVTLGSSGQNATLQYSGPSVSFNLPFIFAAGGTGTFQIDNASTILTRIGVGMTGGGGLIKSGAGTLWIDSNSDEYFGNTTVNAGIFRLSGNANQNTTYYVNGGILVNDSGVFNRPVIVTADGGGLDGISENLYSSTLTTSGGNYTLNINASSAAGSLILGGTVTPGSGLTLFLDVQKGSLLIGSATTFTTNTISLQLESAATFDMNRWSATFGALSGSGTVSDTGGGGGVTTVLTLAGTNSASFSGVIENGTKTTAFVKASTGTQTLSGPSTFTGGSKIKGGTILIGINNVSTTSGALGPSTAAVTLGDTNGMDNASLLTAGAFTFANAVTVLAGSSGTSTLGGSTADDSTFTGNIMLNKSAILTAVAGGNATFSGIISGAGFGITKTDAGTVTLSRANTYTGGTTISAGTLKLGTNNALASTGALTLNGGTFSSQGFSNIVGALTLQSSSTIVLGTNTATLTFASGSYTAGTLTISNWTGTAGVSGTANRIFITAAPSATFLTNITFAGYSAAAIRLGTGEIVPAVATGPTKLAITSINSGSSPTAGTGFSVVVQAQDNGGTPQNVTANTAVTLSLNTGSGTLGGTLTGTITAGTSSVTISGVTYSKAESGVILTATRTSGDSLTAGNSGSFTVNPGAFTRLQLLMPGETAAPGSASGKTGTPSAQTTGVSFTVNVNAVDANWNLINTNDTVAITSSDGSATLPADAALVAGTKSFSVTLNTEGSATVTASDVTNAGITANTSPATTVSPPGSQTITFPSPGDQTYGVAPITLTATASSGLTVTYSVTSGPATVSGNTLTITNVGSVVIQASQTGNGSWSAATPVSQTISIAQKSLTGSITADNKVYDQTNTATIASRSLAGVVGADAVTLTGGTATFADKNVGSGKTVTGTGLSLSGADAGRYVLASTNATTTANITAVGLTVTGITANNKSFDGTTVATLNTGSAALVGVLAGDTVTPNASGATGTFADSAVGTNKTVTVSGLTLSGADAGNYTVTQPTTTADITAVAAPFIWKGSVNSTWDIGTTTNWQQNGTALTYQDGNAVQFDNSGISATPNLSVTVAPLSVTVSNTTAKNYTFTATAGRKLTGAASLTKSGNGSLTLLSLTNDFTGGTTINGGTVILGDGGTTTKGRDPLGTGPITVNTNGEFRFTGPGGAVVPSMHFNLTNDVVINGGTIHVVEGIPHFTNSTVTVGDAGGTLLTRWSNKVLTFDSIVTGSGNLLVGTDGNGSSGPGVVFNNSSNTYNGIITVTNLTSDLPIVVVGDTNGLALANATVNLRVLNGLMWSNTIVTLGGLSGSANLSLNTAPALQTLKVGNNNSNTLYSGVLSGTGALVKLGSGTLTLSNINTYTGGTIVSAGTLALGTSNVLANAGALTMDGGTFSNQGYSETLGALTNESSSTFVLGTNATGTLTFASGSYTAGTLTISNWTGTAGVSGTANRIFITAAPSATFLTNITFSGYAAAAIRLGTGEIVPSGAIPTPTKLAITLVNGGSSPTVGAAFSVVVQAQDAGGTPRNVLSDTAMTLSLNTGSGTLGGTLTGTITAGTNSVTISSVTYSKAENGVILTATRTSGDSLTAGNSSSFNVSTAVLTVTGVTASNKVYDGNTTATVSTNSAALVGVVGGDTVTLTGTAAGTFANSSVATGKTVTVSGLTLSGTDAGNYTLTQPTTTADITAASTLNAVASSSNPSPTGSNITFTATLSVISPGAGTPTGNVIFKDGATAFGTNALNGSAIATFNITTLSHGSHTIAAEYAGDENFFGSTNSLNQVINTAPVATNDTLQRYQTTGVKVRVSTLLTNDTDADADALTLSSVSPTSTQGGTIIASAPWVFYTPAPGFTNADSFSYVITDGGLQATGSVSVNIRVDLDPSQNVTAVQDLGNGSNRVTFAGIPGRVYTIQYTTNLVTPNWQALGTNTADTIGRFEFTDAPPQGSPARFYRSTYP